MTPSSPLFFLIFFPSCLVFLRDNIQQMNAFIRTFLCEFSFTFPFGLLLLTLGPLYKLKGLYAPILFLVLFVFTSVSWLYSRDPSICNFTWQKLFWKAL